MPTVNSPINADTWISCDDGIHLILMDESNDHFGWVFRQVKGGWPYSVRKATEHEMAHARARQHLRIGVAQIAGQAPAPQAHPEPASYPPCDYCGTVPSYHPWHGSGMLNGVENRHIHACDACRGQLPLHPVQPHAEPIAWMVGTAFWWTIEEAERDAKATGLPIVPVGPLAPIPDGYCLMPKRLTAENGAKALLLGEFKLEVTRECPECLELDEPEEGCEICDGAGEYGQRHTIPWDMIKYIYSMAVKGLALQPDLTSKPS
ncbi:hypothetical protein R1Y13_11005 [Pseudomonas sp. NY8938]|uniref:hypothetical protein n=1 Tax=Pseudomonas sp. NY8938 TaxID=3081664 RepID=UPI00385727AD